MICQEMICDSAIVEKLHEPLQGKIEEWKRVATQLEKDHSRGWFDLVNCYAV